jgi:hypothetical protein
LFRSIDPERKSGWVGCFTAEWAWHEMLFVRIRSEATIINDLNMARARQDWRNPKE